MELKDFVRHFSSRFGGSEEVGDWFLDGGEALALIEMARKYRLVVLGIEGFRHESGRLTADLSLIADFSSTLAEAVGWHIRVERSCRDALVFVETYAAASIRFNFVLANEPAE